MDEATRFSASQLLELIYKGNSPSGQEQEIKTNENIEKKYEDEKRKREELQQELEAIKKDNEKQINELKEQKSDKDQEIKVLNENYANNTKELEAKMKEEREIFEDNQIEKEREVERLHQIKQIMKDELCLKELKIKTMEENNKENEKKMEEMQKELEKIRTEENTNIMMRIEEEKIKILKETFEEEEKKREFQLKKHKQELEEMQKLNEEIWREKEQEMKTITVKHLEKIKDLSFEIKAVMENCEVIKRERDELQKKEKFKGTINEMHMEDVSLISFLADFNDLTTIDLVTTNYATTYKRIIKNVVCQKFYNQVIEPMNLDYEQFLSMMFNFYEKIDKHPGIWMRLLYFVTLILISDSNKYKNFLALTRFYIV